jgi:hypothetical protein
MATKIKPLHDRVIIRRIEDNVNQTAGGLFIPDTAKEKPQEGEVIAVGEGKYKDDGTRWTSRPATELFLENTAARRSNSTARNFLSCARTRSSASSTGRAKPLNKSGRSSQSRKSGKSYWLSPLPDALDFQDFKDFLDLGD